MRASLPAPWHTGPDHLRYAQCWEDADILLTALQIKAGDCCLSIASAGDNSLALLIADPAQVVAIDLTPSQLHALALRVAAYRNLQHPELLELIGSRPSTRRLALLQRCLPDLIPEAQDYWRQQAPAVARWGVGGVGRFERYFRLFRQFVLPLAHRNATVQALLQPRTPAERRHFYQTRWQNWRWRLLMRLFFSQSVMARLGRDPAFFTYAEGSMAEQVARRTAHALQTLDPAQNPYLHWILTGQHGATLPLALRPEHFATIRARLDRVSWHLLAAEATGTLGLRFDAFNLSDIFEYLAPETHAVLYGHLLACANPGARLAYWNMRVLRAAPAHLEHQVRRDLARAETLHAQDRAFFYRRLVLETVLPAR